MSCGEWSADGHGRMLSSKTVVIQLVTHIATQVSRRITAKACSTPWCTTPERVSTADGGLQLLTFRRLSPRQPAIPVAYAFAQFGPLNTELSAAGGSALRARVLITAKLLCLLQVMLRWWSEQDGLLICVITFDDAVALVYC
jgi:hypothetical protein